MYTLRLTAVCTARRCHTKSVITKPQNVCVMRDIMCSGYIAGGNTRFFGEGTDGDIVDCVKTGLNNRLAAVDDASGDYESMFAFACPFGDATGAARDQVISISSKLLPWEAASSDGAKRYFPGGEHNFETYNQFFDLDSIHYGEDRTAQEGHEYMSQGRSNCTSLPPPPLHARPCTCVLCGCCAPLPGCTCARLECRAGSFNNSLCFVGPHRKYNTVSSAYHHLIPGQGHFGPDAIPGVRAPCWPSWPCDRRAPACSGNTGAACGRTLGGVVESLSRSRRPATAWCRWKWRRRRRCL